jgi:hypothetical protein
MDLYGGISKAAQTASSTANNGLSGANFMPYVTSATDIIGGLTMPKLDYGGIETMEDAKLIAQQAKDKAGKIGSGIGGAAGAAIGSVVPVLGTAVGGMIGSLLGGLGGQLFGGGAQAEKAKAIANERQAKMNAIIQSRKDRAMEYDLVNGNTIFQSF